MDVRARLTVQIATLVGLTSLLVASSRVVAPGAGALGLVGLAVFSFCWLVMTLAAVLMTESDLKRPQLLRLFDTRSVGLLYQWVIHRPASWPRDWRMYDWAVRLAVAYPILFALGAWGWGLPVTLGGADLIAAEPAAWRRAVGIGGLVIVSIVIFSDDRIGKATEKGFMRKFSGRLNVDRWAPWVVGGAVALALAFVVAVLVAVAVADAGVFPGSFIVALLISSAFFVGGAGALALALALVVGGAGIVGGAVALGLVSAVVFLQVAVIRRGHGNAGYVALTLVGFAAVFWAIRAADWAEAQVNQRFWLVFFGLLPLLNAVFDYLSYLITFTLLRCGYHRPRLAAVLGLVDLGAAFGLFVLSGAAIVVAISLANHLAGVALYPLLPLLDGIAARPQAYWWVYLMLFSTLMPTVLHMAVGAFSLGVLLPERWRERLRAGIGAADPWPATLTPVAIGGYWALCLVLPVLALWGLWWAFAHWVYPYPFAGYLDWLRSVVFWADAFWPNAV